MVKVRPGTLGGVASGVLLVEGLRRFWYVWRISMNRSLISLVFTGVALLGTYFVYRYGGIGVGVVFGLICLFAITALNRQQR